MKNTYIVGLNIGNHDSSACLLKNGEIVSYIEQERISRNKLAIGEAPIDTLKACLRTENITLKDIIDELSKPGRDPREDLPKPILRSDVLKFEDLQLGMELTGTVRNVIDFGAFVDVGVKHDGLVHISELSDKFIKNPSEVVSVGDIVKVRVIGIDREKQKISL